MIFVRLRFSAVLFDILVSPATTHNAEKHTKLYANMPMQYTAVFHGCKNGNFQMKKMLYFSYFSQNIDCGYTLTSTYNLCFRAKIRK